MQTTFRAARHGREALVSPGLAETPLANQEFTIDWGSVMAQESHDHVVAASRDRIDNLIAADTSAHLEALYHLRCAVESRDLIGQAKGLVMAKTGCSSEDAFDLLRAQSQHENRKLTDIAAELVERHNRRGVLRSRTRESSPTPARRAES